MAQTGLVPGEFDDPPAPFHGNPDTADVLIGQRDLQEFLCFFDGVIVPEKIFVLKVLRIIWLFRVFHFLEVLPQIFGREHFPNSLSEFQDLFLQWLVDLGQVKMVEELLSYQIIPERPGGRISPGFLRWRRIAPARGWRSV